MIKVELDQHEADTLIKLLDVAVRAQGLSIAVAALSIAQKVQFAAQAANAPKAAEEDTATK